MSEQQVEDGRLPRVAVLCGSDVERLILWDNSTDLDGTGNNDSWRLIDTFGQHVLPWSRIHLTPRYFRQARRWDLRKFDVVWNMISDPDQNPQTLEVAAKVLADGKLPVVNRPAQMALTRRDRMAERLTGLAGVVTPRVLLLRNPSLDRVRRAVDNAGFHFPAILRLTGTQSGQIIGLFERLEDLPIFGDRRNEYFMTEYYNLRFSDGHFRKSRLMFIGDKVVIRQHIISDRWNIRGADNLRIMATDESLRHESMTTMREGFEALPAGFRDAVLAIRARIPLDYCGLDACLAEDGRVVVFEANATMNVWPHFDDPTGERKKIVLKPMLKAVRRLILAKAAHNVDNGDSRAQVSQQAGGAVTQAQP